MLKLGICAVAMAAELLSIPCAIGAENQIKMVAREVLAKNKAAVISVKLVVTTRTVQSGKQVDKSEAKHEVAGTIVDPSGLTVISASVLDPEESEVVEFFGNSAEEGEKTESK